jgi:hypothetical protein
MAHRVAGDSAGHVASTFTQGRLAGGNFRV